jgi:uncharacterized protein
MTSDSFAPVFERESGGPLRPLIDSTPWIDTHEHLVEERVRLGNAAYAFEVMGNQFVVPGDWSALIAHYVIDDLVSAGLPPSAREELIGPARSPLEKWDLVSPYLDAVRNGGYMQAVDITTERLFGLRLARENCERVGGLLGEFRVPGFYERTLREIANVERCQVHSVDQDPFCESEHPDLLNQDMSIAPLVYGHHSRAEELAGVEVETLDDYLAVIEWCFRSYGHRVVAVKCYWAYRRPLAVAFSEEAPTAAFQRVRAGSGSEHDHRAVEDFLFARCLDLATSYGLPVKLHLGTLSGNGDPRLRFVRDHVSDVIPIAQRYPQTRFVLMHTAWPHTEELIALAKHQSNVAVDLCWSWIVAPLSTVEFVRRFVTTAPTNKLFCFGGDYVMVEHVVGHAELARRGLQRALETLVQDGWLGIGAAEELVPRLMRQNAEEWFPAPASAPAADRGEGRE